MPNTVTKSKITIGTQALVKGEVREGKQLVAWDCIQDCVPEHCPIGTTCAYSAASQAEGRCSLQIEYVQSFVDMMFRTYRYLNEDDLFKVGMHLIPLYSQLCRQKIVEKGVGRLCYEDSKGNTKIHPIHREIRDTLRSISLAWRDLEIEPLALADPTANTAAYKAGFGDPGHYARLIQGADNKRNVIR